MIERVEVVAPETSWQMCWARCVLEEDLRVAGAGDDLLEEVPCDVVGRHATLAVQGAGETVLVLKAEDPALHLGCRGDFRYGLMLLSEPHALQPAVPTVRKR